MKGKDEGFRGFYSYVKLTDSKEYADLKIFLDTCKDMGIKPTIVLIPGMPEFYDFAGIGVKDRKAFAKKIRGISDKYNTRLIDLDTTGTHSSQMSRLAGPLPPWPGHPSPI